jgi:hypothetical protein
MDTEKQLTVFLFSLVLRVQIVVVLTLAGFLAAYLSCGAAALWFGQASRHNADRAGTMGENRVVRTLTQAGYAVPSEVTLQLGNGTHQIDHVVVVLTGSISSKPRLGAGHWGQGRGPELDPLAAQGAGGCDHLQPTLSESGHAEVISVITRVPVTPLVVSAGFLTMPQDLTARVLPLPGLPAFLALQL